MFQAEVVRVEVDAQGIVLRVWMYDQADEFRAAGELRLEGEHVTQWQREWHAKSGQADQSVLGFPI